MKGFFILILALFTFVSCKKDGDSAPNSEPTCAISLHVDGTVFAHGELITIYVYAKDSDGMINEVHFFIDDVKLGSDFSAPYSYEWDSTPFSIGEHIIKCSCIDDKGASAEDELIVTLVEVGSFTDPRDDQEYETIQIGDQTWLAENLNYQSANSVYYFNDPIIGGEYGSLYNWEEASEACPEGWHIPSDEEWKTLEAFLGMDEGHQGAEDWRGSFEGSLIKCDYGWSSVDSSSNSTYFSALPGGYFDAYSMSFFGGGNVGLWWTSTSSISNYAYYRQLEANNYQIYRSSIQKDNMLSLRCVKDL